MSFAKVVLMGNLGRDPDLRYTQNGTPVCSFSMATTEKFTKQGEKQEKTTWWKITIWGRQAETASQYLVKGKAVVIEGRPSLEVWTDKDGKERTDIVVNATDMHFVSDGGGGGGNYSDRTPSQGQGQANRAAGGGGRQPGPREAYHQSKQQQSGESAPASGGLALDDDDVPF